MENFKQFVKIPQVKFITGLISVGVIVYIGAKLYTTVVQGQVINQQKQINKYILKEYQQKKS